MDAANAIVLLACLLPDPTDTTSASPPVSAPLRLLMDQPGPDTGEPELILDPQTRERVLADSTGKDAGTRALDRATFAGVRAGGRELLLDVERFDLVAPGALLTVGRERRAAEIDLSLVALYRGTVLGDLDAHVFLAIGTRGVLGQIDLGAGEGRWVIGPRGPERRGLAARDLAVVEVAGFGAPPLVDPCVVLEPPAGEGGVAGPIEPEGFTDARRRRLDLAIDSDHEFFTLFGDLDAAAEYVTALVGAMAEIYRRELIIDIRLVYLRLWDVPEDLFNESDPLVPFRDWWNLNMTDVQRDAAMLLTGRRNLPYGGVAWLSALCGDFAYSVCGYLNGTFASTDASSAGNWDLVVCAHELGHNCGTLHTHDYGLDNCAGGSPRRGGIMSYCHTVSGGVSNVDMLFETPLRGEVQGYVSTAPCVAIDCDGNGVEDAEDIALGTVADANADGIPDQCQDCDGDGVLDPAEILLGIATDLDGNGVPDDCEPDCNGNGRPDALDILDGTSSDIYLDGVPDECEVDCDADGTSDLIEINLDMTLDVDRNRVLDACQDCDDDGVGDLVQLAGGLHIWMAGNAPTLRRFHGGSGAPTGVLGQHGGATVSDMALLPDGRLAVAGLSNSTITLIDPVSGASLGTLVPAGSGGLSSPGSMLVLPPNRLLVASQANARVLEYDATTGAFVRVLVAGALSQLVGPWGMAIAADGALLVTGSNGSIRRYDAETGAFLGVLVEAGSGGLVNPRGLFVLDDGSVLAAAGTNGLLRFDGVAGAFLGRWDKGGVTNGFWGLRQPWVMRRSADGLRLLVSNTQGSAGLHSYDLQTGFFLRSFYVLAQDLSSPTGFVELPPSPQDCNLNLVPDACDISGGASADRNGNGLPDECELLPSPDLNGDGLVDGADLGLLLLAWGPCPSPPAACGADLNTDGQVDGADLGLLLLAWS